MKFRKYLKESEADAYYEVWLKELKEWCGPYLNDLKKNKFKYPFWRGLNVSKKFPGQKNIRQDRKPKGMSDTMAKFINDWLEDRKYLRRDQSVIATSDDRHANRFGTLCMIFQVHDYKFTYVKMDDINISTSNKDLYNAIKCEYWLSDYADSLFKEIDNKEMYEKLVKLYGSKLVNDRKNIMSKGFSDKNLKEAYDKKYEIWFGNVPVYYY